MKRTGYIILIILLVGAAAWLATCRKVWFMPAPQVGTIHIRTLSDTLSVNMDSTYCIDLQTTRVVVVYPGAWHRMVDYTRANTWLHKTINEAGDHNTVVILPQHMQVTNYAWLHPLNFVTIVRPLQKATVVFYSADADNRLVIPE